MPERGQLPIRNVAASGANLRNVIEARVGEPRAELAPSRGLRWPLPFDSVEVLLAAIANRASQVAGVSPERFEKAQFHQPASGRLFPNVSLTATRKPTLSARCP